MSAGSNRNKRYRNKGRRKKCKFDANRRFLFSSGCAGEHRSWALTSCAWALALGASRSHPGSVLEPPGACPKRPDLIFPGVKNTILKRCFACNKKTLQNGVFDAWKNCFFTLREGSGRLWEGSGKLREMVWEVPGRPGRPAGEALGSSGKAQDAPARCLRARSMRA